MRPVQWVLTVAGVAGLAAGLLSSVVLPSDDSLGGRLLWVGLGVVPTFAVGVWLAHRRPDHPQARRLLALGVAMAAGIALEGPLRAGFAAPAPPVWLPWADLANQLLGSAAVVAAGLLIATYPDGTVEREWQRRVLWVVRAPLVIPVLLLLCSPVLTADAYLLDTAPDTPNPVAIAALAPLGPPLATLQNGYYGIVVAAALMLTRFALAGPAGRTRMRLLVWTMTACVLVLLAGNALRGLGIPDDSPAGRVITVLSVAMSCALPVVIVVGVLRHGLFDLRLTVRRSVLYGATVLVIAAGYVALSAAPGLAFGSQVPVELAVVVTVLAAALFQPLRRRFEALADRWVYGERVDRYRLLTSFGAGLEQTLELAELLPRLAATVRHGLDARWVRVSLPETAATSGTVDGPAALTVPLEHGGAVVGRIECGPIPDGHGDADRELITTLARQAAPAIANVRLTAQLAERLDDLTASRARLVSAADAERRRIERDLHDGVQQHVVALIAKIRLSRNAIDRGRPAADALAEVQADAVTLLADLRELVHGIRPPVLADRGLVEAIEARADRMPMPVSTRADADLRERRFAADVEATAYFVVCEALTNVVKHAGAAGADVELSAVDGRLTVSVRDDGCGTTMSGNDNGNGSADGSGSASCNGTGQGLTNLRDRVEAVGGRLQVDGVPGAGTRVCAELPAGGTDG